MKCAKHLVLSGYKVTIVDLRQPKPRQPQEKLHVVDRQWLDAIGLLGQNITDNIRERYERAGYKVISVEAITPKQVVTVDLLTLWGQSLEEKETEHNG